jgi:hypothetical protein
MKNLKVSVISYFGNDDFKKVLFNLNTISLRQLTTFFSVIGEGGNVM